jgi:hypothetical protein
MKAGFFPRSSLPLGETRVREQAVKIVFSTACYRSSNRVLRFGNLPGGLLEGSDRGDTAVFLLPARLALATKQKVVFLSR